MKVEKIIRVFVWLVFRVDVSQVNVCRNSEAFFYAG